MLKMLGNQLKFGAMLALTMLFGALVLLESPTIYATADPVLGIAALHDAFEQVLAQQGLQPLPPTPRAAGRVFAQQQIITDPTAQTDNRFGFAMDISADGSTAIIGSVYESEIDSSYIFVRSGNSWVLQANLPAPSADPKAYFGSAVALSANGDIALVSAPGNPGNDFQDDVVYVFTRQAGIWTQTSTIDSPDLRLYQLYGYSVALSADGTTALVGAPHDYYGASDISRAYVF
ncbi:MAG: hypothetical protein H7Y11_12185, partial [Armatimonadetes bacterium]|nr:hypothetical protein [Anaerolineae bacterium]